MKKENEIIENKDSKPVVRISETGDLILQDLEQLYRVANMFATSGMVPKDYENKPHAVAVAIVMGQSVGLPPMAAVQNISVINGRPAIWGDAMIGIVRASGLIEDISEYFQGDNENSDDFTAVCIARRKGQKSEISGYFSVADAKRSKLWGTNVWAKYPKRMLQMRARGLCLRDGFADVLKGIQLYEELRDYESSTTSIEIKERKKTTLDDIDDIVDGDFETVQGKENVENSLLLEKETNGSEVIDKIMSDLMKNFPAETTTAKSNLKIKVVKNIDQAESIKTEVNKILDESI